MISRLTALLAVVLLTGCGGASSPSTSTHSAVSVFAASSLQPAFDRIAAQLQAKRNVTATFNYAGTQTLAAQLQQGAQADVFASADTAHMTQVEGAGLLAGASRTFAHNQLEIVVEHGNPKGIHTLADLSRPSLVVVLADPSVPAGKYAAQALRKAGVTVHPASLELQVTGVLNKVALGEADAGIVYASDVATSGKVEGVAIPDDQNVIADYPIAALRSAADPTGAQAFIDLVLSPDGQAILKAAGFQGA